MVPEQSLRVWARCAAVLLCLCSMACTPHFERPTVMVQRIEYRGGNLLQQDFDVRLSIHNPNAHAIPVAGIEAQLRLDGDPIASGASEQPFVVPPHGDGQCDLAIRADLAAGLLKLLGRHDALPYELAGKVRIDLPMMRPMPFQTQGSINLTN